MSTSLPPLSNGAISTPERRQAAERRRPRAAQGRWGLAAALVLSLSLPGCGSDSGDTGDAADAGQTGLPAQTVSVADMQRFPAPPDSRSMAAMDEPEASLALPLGAAAADGDPPVRRVEGRVFRRVSMVSTGAVFDVLLDHYRSVVAEGSYEVQFECEGIESCGGARFVSAVIEGYVTAPRNVSRASTVIALTQPSGDLGHFSLAREHPGAVEFVGVTVVRSENGPLTVVTQQAFVATGD